MDDFGKLFIKIGILFIAIGAIAIVLKRFGINLGRLPGDIRVEREGFSFAFPIVTCILLSLLLSAIAQIFFRNK